MRTLRLAALGLHHESNTFAHTPTDLAAFQSAGLLRADEIRERLGPSQSTMAGFLDAGDHRSIDVVPLLFCFPNPGGPITAEAFEFVSAEMCMLLRQGGPWDGVLMAQHGAAVCASYERADEELVARTRAIVGPSIPIGLALDLHGNISPGLVRAADVVVGYRTNPHRDARERARECAELVARTTLGSLRPKQALVRVAAVPNILRQSTDEAPFKDVYAAVAAEMEAPGAQSASVFQGYPYADVPDMAIACLAVHDDDQDAAVGRAHHLAELVWSRREELCATAIDPERAVELAARSNRGPVVLLDVGDNIGAGSPGDSTILLELALRFDLQSFLVTLCDPEAAYACVAAGRGARVCLPVGAKANGTVGRPVPIDGTVIAVHDGAFEDPGPTHGGFRHFDAGRTAAIQCRSGQIIVLSSKLIQNISLRLYDALGLDPRAYQVVVAKGVNAPRLAYSSIASEMITVNSPGVTAADLSLFQYTRRPRPLYPFETEVVDPIRTLVPKIRKENLPDVAS